MLSLAWLDSWMWPCETARPGSRLPRPPFSVKASSWRFPQSGEKVRGTPHGQGWYMCQVPHQSKLGRGLPPGSSLLGPRWRVSVALSATQSAGTLAAAPLRYLPIDSEVSWSRSASLTLNLWSAPKNDYCITARIISQVSKFCTLGSINKAF